MTDKKSNHHLAYFFLTAPMSPLLSFVLGYLSVKFKFTDEIIIYVFLGGLFSLFPAYQFYWWRRKKSGRVMMSDLVAVGLMLFVLLNLAAAAFMEIIVVHGIRM